MPRSGLKPISCMATVSHQNSLGLLPSSGVGVSVANTAAFLKAIVGLNYVFTTTRTAITNRFGNKHASPDKHLAERKHGSGHH